jgi:hypothetical protein
MMRRLVTRSALLVLAAVAPASAQVQKPADVIRVEDAIVELAKQKRGADGQLSARRRAAQKALGACRSRGAGWMRIRRVRDRAQRSAYARAARALWADLGEVAVEGVWVDAYAPYFERFLRGFDAPLSDPVLQAGVEAQRKRVAYNRAAYSFGTCATFETLLGKVREFKVGGAHGVRGDYRAGRLYNGFVRYVANRQRAAARAHWGSRYEDALDAAGARLKALGGNEGYANYFAFAFRG